MEKMLGITLKQSYVNRIRTMLNLGMIPTGNSDIIHRFLLRNAKGRDSDLEESKLGWLLQAVLQSNQRPEPTSTYSASTQGYREYMASRDC